jgi:peroxiredoxin
MSLAIGDGAPPFDLPTVSGERASLEGLADRPAVAVVFSCNHCPYVLAWEDRLDAIAREYAPRGLAVVAVNANDAGSHPRDSFPNMQRHAAEKGFSYPYAHDESQAVARAYGASRTPEVFLFDRERRLVYHGAIDDSRDPGRVRERYLRDALDALLDDGVPAVAETPPVGCTIKWRR